MNSLLTINAGSSSVRFAVHGGDVPYPRTVWGIVDSLDAEGGQLTVHTAGSETPAVHRLEAPLSASLLDWLEENVGLGDIAAVGHRIVHGLRRSEPEWVTEALLSELNRIRPYAPEHLPRELSFVEALARWHPNLRQLVCFDTAFHRTMPRVATWVPIPSQYRSEGVQRYGFHGLSYAILVRELVSLGEEAASRGRVILAHLGNGASLAAVHAGVSVDTSMGFTPASGLPMGTRSGDLDPGVFGYLAERGGMTPAQFDWMVNHESGLLGISGTSSDMRELLAREREDERAADAVDLFCYQARKWVGAFAAVLGGVDTLVFSGGIGENCPEIRSRICGGLGFLGLDLDPLRNSGPPGVISSEASRVSVRVIRTDESLMIARITAERLQSDPIRTGGAPGVEKVAAGHAASPVPR